MSDQTSKAKKKSIRVPIIQPTKIQSPTPAGSGMGR